MTAPTLHRIRASAGSGKTYALTDRFIDLLSASAADTAPSACGRHADGYSWQEIRAVTFTNRAADEMRRRIVLDMKKLALGTADKPRKEFPPDRAARWVSRLLMQYGSLKVGTIDSLLLSVVRMAALGLGLPPDISPSFDAGELVNPLIDLVLAWTDEMTELTVRKACHDLNEYDPDILGLTGKSILRNAVLQLFETMDRDHILRLFEHMDRDAAQDIPFGDYADVASLHEREASLANNLAATAQNLKDGLDKDKLEPTKAFTNVLNKCVDRPDVSQLKDSKFRPLEDCLLKASKGRCTDEARRLYGSFTDALRRFLDEVPTIERALPYAEFIPLAKIVYAVLADHMKKSGVVPQLFIAPMAADVLERTDAAEILCRMGGGLAHLLVDEFQDTSADQWRALRPLVLDALSRGGSLIWVGDVKQSIYGWRGGDPSLFDTVLHDPDLSAVVPNPVDETLPDNWRSREEIVKFNNAVFSRLADLPTAREIMHKLTSADSETEADHLAVAFSHVIQTPAVSKGVVCHPGGLVTVGVLQASSSSELEGLVKTALTGLMDDILCRRPLGDIAILVRTNDQALLVSKWLSDRDIQVVTEASLRIDTHPLVQEILAVLTLADGPDDAAIWTLLSGGRLLDGRLPEGFLPENWVFSNAGRNTLSHRLEITAPEVWKAIVGLLQKVVNPDDAYGTIADTLGTCRVAARLPDEFPFAERLLEASYLAANDGIRSTSSFLALRKDEEDECSLPDGPDAVRIMTVHKAKGLAFPVVIVPWNEIDCKPSNTLRRTVLGGKFILTPLSKGDPDYTSKAAAIAREALHRTYVAWTRAVDELHVLLTSTKSTGQSKASAEVFRILTDGLLVEGADTVIGAPETPRMSLEATTAKVPEVTNLPMNDGKAGWLPALDVSEPEKTTADEDWAECENNVSDREVKKLLARLKAAGVPAPVAGYDIGVGGAVVDEAELAWPGSKIGVLMTENKSLINGCPGWTFFIMGNIDADNIVKALRG